MQLTDCEDVELKKVIFSFAYPSVCLFVKGLPATREADLRPSTRSVSLAETFMSLNAYFRFHKLCEVAFYSQYVCATVGLHWVLQYCNSQTTGFCRLAARHDEGGKSMKRKETRVSYLVQQEGYGFQLCAAQQDPANWAFECVSSALRLRPLIRCVISVSKKSAQTLLMHRQRLRISPRDRSRRGSTQWQLRSCDPRTRPR